MLLLLTACDSLFGTTEKESAIDFYLDGGEWNEGYQVPQSYIEGEVTLLPTADNLSRKNYVFAGWVATDYYADSNQILTKIGKDSTGDREFLAKWVPVSYTIEFELDGGSWRKDFEVPVSYDVETSISLPNSNFISKSGYNFEGWYEKSDYSDSKVEKIATGSNGNKKYYAKWIKVTYTIKTVSSNGTVTVNKTSANAGELITLTVTPESGYEFDSFRIGEPLEGLDISNNSFTMPAHNVVLVAIFKLRNNLISISPTIEHGSISVNKTSAKKGEEIYLDWTPSDGYELQTITVTTEDGTSISVSDNSFIMPAGNVLINASFSLAKYSITIEGLIQNGTVTVDKTIAYPGDTVTVNITPNNGYRLRGISVTGAEFEGSGNTRTFIMQTKNAYVHAAFEVIPTYSITVQNSTNGSVTVNSTVARVGETVTLSINPYTGYELDKISVSTNSSSIPVSGNGNSRTFIMPEASVVIQSSFDIIYTPLVVGANGKIETTETYVTFGEWPQTKKTDPNITINENVSKVVGEYTYYKGSDDAWYAKYGSVYYKVEPIKWRVLNPDAAGTSKKMLIAQRILTNCSFYNYDGVNRTIGGQLIYSNNYEHSRIRAYLNGLEYQIKLSNSSTQQEENVYSGKGFLYTAFNASERNAIANTSVSNNARSANSRRNGNYYNNGENIYASDTATSDKIFILSEEEVTCYQDGFGFVYDPSYTDNLRKRTLTDFARASGGYTPGTNICWWLRSPSYDNNESSFFVYDNGKANGTVYVHSYMGVVPALCLDN